MKQNKNMFFFVFNNKQAKCGNETNKTTFFSEVNNLNLIFYFNTFETFPIVFMLSRSMQAIYDMII